MKRLVLLVVAVVVAAAVPALADSQVRWGLRGGVTIDPDQAYFGAHLDAGEMFPHGHFVPNIEFGFGDHTTLIALNPELAYRFDPAPGSAWGFYAGGGLGVNFYSWDTGWHGHDGSDTQLGLNLLGGATRRMSGGNELFFEVKLGLADSPSGKIGVGVTFP
jgi:hypothetical protein